MEHALYKQMTVRAHCSGRVKNTLTCTYTCMMSQCCVPAPILRELIASPAPNKLKRLAHETRCVSSGTDTQLLDIVFVHWYTLTQKWCNNHNMKWVYHIAGKSRGKWHTCERVGVSTVFCDSYSFNIFLSTSVDMHVCTYVRTCALCVDSICHALAIEVNRANGSQSYKKH